MKRLLFGSVCFLVASGPAFAESPFFYGDTFADAPKSHLDHRRQIRDEVEQPREFMSSRALWDGVYFGANAGLAGGDFRYPVSVTSSTGGVLGSGAIGLKSDGFVGGGMAGFNTQMGNKFVGGFEADIQASSLTGQVSVDAGQTSIKAGSRLDYLGTVRGRLGALVVGDQGLLYATGGFAYAGVNNFISGSDGGGSGSISKATLATGWTAGGGFEYALSDRWSLRTEYLYVDLGKQSLLAGTAFGYTATLGVETTANIVRAGVTYRFGAPEPVIAKY